MSIHVQSAGGEGVDEVALTLPALHVAEGRYLGDGEVVTTVVTNAVTACQLRVELEEYLVGRGYITR